MTPSLAPPRLPRPAPVLLLLASLMAVTASCRTSRAIPPTPPAPDQGRLVPTEQMQGAFLLRQRIVARFRDRTVPALDAALQLHEGELSLLGLTPFGTRAFLIRQRGTEVTTESFIAELPPIDPRQVLGDVHRVLFRGLFIGKPPPPDGLHTGRDGDEHLTESWQNHHLTTRTFATAPNAPPTLRITFEGEGPILPPPSASTTSASATASISPPSSNNPSRAERGDPEGRGGPSPPPAGGGQATAPGDRQGCLGGLAEVAQEALRLTLPRAFALAPRSGEREGRGAAAGSLAIAPLPYPLPAARGEGEQSWSNGRSTPSSTPSDACLGGR